VKHFVFYRFLRGFMFVVPDIINVPPFFVVVSSDIFSTPSTLFFCVNDSLLDYLPVQLNPRRPGCQPRF